MKTDEWIDKRNWGAGEWQDEPDRAEWVDEKTGYPCIIRRVELHGALCGYVGIPEKHPYFGLGDSDLDDVDVHGGLTFASNCQEENPRGICHQSPEKRWWLGFDTAHCDDYLPKMERDYPSMPRFGRTQTYKNFEYMKNQIASLAAQLKRKEAA